jgi:hypothetical protein
MHEIVTRLMKCVTATRLRLLDIGWRVWPVMPHSTRPHIESGIRDNREAAPLFSNRVHSDGPTKCIDLPATARYPKPNAKKASIRLVNRFGDNSKQDHCPLQSKH